MQLIPGRSFISDTWELRASSHDGKGFRPVTSAHVEKSWVRPHLRISIVNVIILMFYRKDLVIYVYNCSCFSRHAEKYVRRGRLDWPEGATSRESIKSVMKLPRLQVCKMIYFPCIMSLGNDVNVFGKWCSGKAMYIILPCILWILTLFSLAESSDAARRSLSWGSHRPIARSA